MKIIICGIMNKVWILIILISLFAVSCSEDNLTATKPLIKSISSKNLVVGDTLMLGGENFGWNTASARIVVGSVEINSLNCIKWNNNLIKLEIPNNASSGSVYVVVGTDTSNKTDISISKFPVFEMVEIQPDSFMMGSDIGLTPEQPVHFVRLTKKFFIGKTEVSQRLWKAVMGVNPSKIIMNNLPVYNISWMDAINFCNKLSEIEGFIKCYKISGDTVKIDTNGTGYRLPTEAEWEYSCRAKSNSDFYDNLIIGDIAWYDLNSGYVPHLLSSKTPNSFGLYDIIGNVWEWCWDFYDKFYYNFSPKNNPLGPNNGETHVLRGGSYSDGQTYCRSTNRIFPGNSYENCGLRIVKTVK